MPNDRLLIKREVSTYAEVLLQATQAAGNTFEVAGQAEELVKVLRMSPGLKETLADDTVDLEVRSSIIDEVFKGFDPALLEVFAVMVDRKEMSLLHRVVEEFAQLAEDALGVVIIDVTTVVELDDELRETIKNKFAAQFGKEVMLREHIDPTILGGIVLSAHGKRIDASIATQLEKTRIALSSQMSGGER